MNNAENSFNCYTESHSPLEKIIGIPANPYSAVTSSLDTIAVRLENQDRPNAHQMNVLTPSVTEPEAIEKS
jgi:hypothetical protein